MSFRLTATTTIRSILVRPHTASSRQFVRRLAQDSGVSHTHGKKGSDLPWIIGAVAFTVPASFYLLSDSSKSAHPPAGHEHAPKEEKGTQDISETVRDQAHEAAGKVREEAASAGVADTAAKVKEKSGEKLDNLTAEVKKADEYTGSEESSDNDIESKESGVKKPSEIDEPKAGMEEPASINMQSGKQEGISNQDTRHGELHDEGWQEISKSEGAHETTKLKGTVDPSREAK